MLNREAIEKNQIFIYAITVIIAILVGSLIPHLEHTSETIISIIVGILMFGMFTQIPFLEFKQGWINKSFIKGLLIVNYIAVPLVVFMLTRFIAHDNTLLLGVCLVLLSPCIDYVIVFTHLGKGDAKLMLAATPILFMTQMLLLPLYLMLFINKEAAALIQIKPFVLTFLSFIILPLLLAFFVQLWAKKSRIGVKALDASAFIPVPFMALTLFIVIAPQIKLIISSFDVIVKVVPLYIVFMLFMPYIASFIAKRLKLNSGAGRALLFSSGTRNSLVVLPLTFALPQPLNRIVAAIIVLQTLIELIGELFYIRLIPKLYKNE